MTIKSNGGVFGRNPTFSNVEVTGELTSGGLAVDTNTLYIDSANNRVGIGTSAPSAKLHIANNGGFVALRATNDTDSVHFVAVAASTTVNIGTSTSHPLLLLTGNAGRFRVETNGDANILNGNLVIGTSGKGIDFSATAGTGTSELFSDYEEGTWTPQITDLTYNATMSGNNGGRYTKIGRTVTLTATVETTSLGSMVGGLYISGLPFQPVSFSGAATAGRAAGLNITAGRSVSVYPSLSTPVMFVTIWNVTTGTDFMSLAQWSASGRIEFSYTYIAG